MKFRKKPVVVDACQWDGNWATIRDWMIDLAGGGFAFQVGTAPQIEVVPETNELRISTPEGTMFAVVGDWAVRGVKGGFYPCMPDIFAAIYEPAKESGPC